MKLLRTHKRENQPACANFQQLTNNPAEPDSRFYCENYFNEMIRLEKKRQDRSKIPFLLGFIDISKMTEKATRAEIIKTVKTALFASTRDIDLKGWLKCNAVIGILVTETGGEELSFARKNLLSKIRRALQENGSSEIADKFELIPMIHRHKMPASALDYYVRSWTSIAHHTESGAAENALQSGSRPAEGVCLQKGEGPLPLQNQS